MEKKRNFGIEFLILITIFLFISILTYLNYFESIEVKTIDGRFPYIKTNDLYDNIVIVTIDDEDLAEIGEWPWSRSIHGKLIDNLKEAGASVIAFDMFFTSNSSNKSEDDKFVTACKKAGNVITALPFSTEKILKDKNSENDAWILSSEENPEELKQEVISSKIFPELKKVLLATGIVDLNYDRLNPDGIIRNVSIYRKIDGKNVYALSLEMARAYLHMGTDSIKIGKNYIKFGNEDIPLFTYASIINGKLKFNETFNIRYTGTANDSFQTVPYSDVLNNRVPKSMFKNKIVLVGATSASFFDIKRTPFETMPGMFINALIARSIIEKDFIYRVSRLSTIFILFLITLLAGIYLISFKPSFFDWITIIIFSVGWWYFSIFMLVKFMTLVEVISPITLFLTLIVIVRFHQMFIKIHLTNIELKKINKKLDDRVHDLETLYKLSTSIQTISDIKKTNEIILLRSMEVLKVKIGIFFSYDDYNEKLTIESKQLPPDIDEVRFIKNMEKFIKNFHGNKTLLNLDKNSEHFDSLKEAINGVNSVLLAPLLTNRKDLLGILLFIKLDDEIGFTREEERVLHLVESQVSSYIENMQLYLMAVIDGLTGLYVRRYFDARLNQEVKRCKRYGGELALIMMDIDHFKNFNDTYGHQTGDDVLKITAHIVADGLRDVDLAARYGGEEICVILPETNEEGSWIVGERIRKNIEENRVPGPKGEKLQVTMSLGISIYSKNIKSPEELLKRADTALYESKEGGRNRCTIWREGMG